MDSITYMVTVVGSNPTFRTNISEQETLSRASRGTHLPKLPRDWCCYLLLTSNGSYYCGITANLGVLALNKKDKMEIRIQVFSCSLDSSATRSYFRRGVPVLIPVQLFRSYSQWPRRKAFGARRGGQHQMT